MTRSGKELREKVYDVVKSLLSSTHKNGISPTDIHEANIFGVGYSSISSAMKDLEEEGCLSLSSQEFGQGGRKTYVLTNKEFPREFAEPKPKEPLKESFEPAIEPTSTEAQLAHDLDSLIESLELFHEYYPKVMAGLLDLSKDLGKYRKIKSLLNNMTQSIREEKL